MWKPTDGTQLAHPTAWNPWWCRLQILGSLRPIQLWGTVGVPNLALWSSIVASQGRCSVKTVRLRSPAEPCSVLSSRIFQLCWTGRFLTNPFMSLENVCLIGDCEQVLWGRMESLL